MLESMPGFVKNTVRNGDSWDITTVSEGYYYGPLDLVIDQDGVPHVTYHDHQDPSMLDPKKGDLTHAVLLNGESLSQETCLRQTGEPIAPYMGQWLEFHLENVRPRQGENLLELSLDRRADGLMSPLQVEDVEVIVEYGPYPSGLD